MDAITAHPPQSNPGSTALRSRQAAVNSLVVRSQCRCVCLSSVLMMGYSPVCVMNFVIIVIIVWTSKVGLQASICAQAFLVFQFVFP